MLHLHHCISNIDNTLIDNEENLYIAMSMNNLLEHSDNNSITSGSLCSYYGDEVKDDVNENNNPGYYRINHDRT